MKVKYPQKKQLSIACQIGILGFSLTAIQEANSYWDSSQYNIYDMSQEEYMFLIGLNEERTNAYICGRLNYSPSVKVNKKSYLNNYMDLKTGGIFFDETHFDSGHEILPLKIAARYQTAPFLGATIPKWFDWNDYYIHGELTDDISIVQGYVDDDCNTKRPYGHAISLSQGPEGHIHLYSKISSNNTVEWYTLQKYGNYQKVRLQKNNNGTWTYFNAEKNREETYSKDGLILRIIDASSRIELTWNRDANGGVQITRTGGEWIKQYTDSTGRSISETSGGDKLIGSEHIDKNNKLISKKIYTYKNNLLTKVEHISDNTSRTIAEWTWNKDGFITKQVIDGETTNYSNVFDKSKNEVEITISNTRAAKTKITLDKNLDFKKIVTDGDGTPSATTTFESSHSSDLVETVTSTNALGIRHQSSKNPKGWVSSVYNALGSNDQTHTQTIWHDKWKIPLKIISDRHTISYEYYSDDRPLVTKITKTETQLTDAEQIWTYSYGFHSNGLVSYVRIDGPRYDVNDVSYAYYDANGRLTKEINALGQETTYSNYDANGRPTRIVYPDKTFKKTTYNLRGWAEQEEIGNDYGVSVTKYSYDTRGNITSITDPTQKTLRNRYSGGGKLLSEAMSNERKYYTYDDLGKLAETKYGFIDPEMEEKIGTKSCDINERGFKQ